MLSSEERNVEDLKSFRGKKLHNLRIEYAIEALKGCKEFLEIGSGEGFCTRSIVHWAPYKFERVVGFDFDRQRVEKASGSWTDSGRISYQVADADERYPFEDGAFAAVVILDVLEHVPDPAKTLAECRRVLKPGGVLFLVVPCEGDPAVLHSRLRRKGWDGSLKYVGHIQAFSKSEVRDLLAEAGLAVDWVRYSCHPIGQLADYWNFEIKRLHALKQSRRLGFLENLRFNFMKKAIKNVTNKLSYFESKILSRRNALAMDLNIRCIKPLASA